MKKRILTIIALVLLISIVLFFLSRDGNKTLAQKIPVRNINSKYRLVKLIEKTHGFRIDISDSMIFVLVGDVALMYSLSNPEKKTIIPQKGIYNILLNGDTLQYFETKNNTLVKEVKGKIVETLPLKNAARNVLLTKEEIYVGDYAKYEMQNDFIIRKVSGSLNYNVSKAMSHFLAGTPPACKSLYTEGRMVNLGADTLAFVPYKVNLILKINKHNGGSIAFKTIDTRDRIELLANTINVPGMGTATACQPISGDEYLHTSATGNEKFLIIGSNLTIQKKDTLYNYIDFYNKRDLSYLYSVTFTSIPGNRDYILDVKLYGNELYVLTSKSVYKYYLSK
jgi:hypothetical protein